MEPSFLILTHLILLVTTCHPPTHRMLSLVETHTHIHTYLIDDYYNRVSSHPPVKSMLHVNRLNSNTYYVVHENTLKNPMHSKERNSASLTSFDSLRFTNSEVGEGMNTSGVKKEGA